MKKVSSFILILVVFSLVFSLVSCSNDSGKDVINIQSNVPVSSEEISSEISSEETSSQEVVDKDEWYLILLNPWNELPDDFEVELEKFAGKNMDKRIVDIVAQMFEDAENDGIDLIIASAHRSIEKQTQNFQNQIQTYKNLGYSDEDAYNEAKQWVAVPGTSEHHTGLALDIVTPSYQVLDHNYDKTDAFKWLYENCADYGFILRYPKNTTHITGIVYEPWHYRYVGVEVAKYIMQNNITFEEYLEEIS